MTRNHEVHVTALDQIPPGEGRTFLVEDQRIAVFHTHDGSVYATQAHCPHRNGPLADGLIGGTTLVCPLHDRSYDLKTGCGLSHDHHHLVTYPTRLAADGHVWVVVAAERRDDGVPATRQSSSVARFQNA